MAEAPTVSDVTHIAAEPTRRASGRWLALIGQANLGLYLGYIGTLSVLLPNQV